MPGTCAFTAVSFLEFPIWFNPNPSTQNTAKLSKPFGNFNRISRGQGAPDCICLASNRVPESKLMRTSPIGDFRPLAHWAFPGLPFTCFPIFLRCLNDLSVYHFYRCKFRDSYTLCIYLLCCLLIVIWSFIKYILNFIAKMDYRLTANEPLDIFTIIHLLYRSYRVQQQLKTAVVTKPLLFNSCF